MIQDKLVFLLIDEPMNFLSSWRWNAEGWKKVDELKRELEGTTDNSGTAERSQEQRSSEEEIEFDEGGEEAAVPEEINVSVDLSVS